MNDMQKSQIINMRADGIGYRAIAKELDISENTIKSFCRNNNLSGTFTPKKCYCKECGKEIIQKEHTKKRIFCSERCKRSWWNKNRIKLGKTKLEEHTCLNCHKPFKAYPHENRKYCCHTCYIEDRFKGGDGDE